MFPNEMVLNKTIHCLIRKFHETGSGRNTTVVLLSIAITHLACMLPNTMLCHPSLLWWEVGSLVVFSYFRQASWYQIRPVLSHTQLIFLYRVILYGHKLSWEDTIQTSYYFVPFHYWPERNYSLEYLWHDVLQILLLK